jgi:acetyltransferase-like isoleucine patch superfamily enzyme
MKSSVEHKHLSRQSLADQLHNPSKSSLGRYSTKVLGNAGLGLLLYYEFVNLLFCNMPSSLGYVLRRISYRRLFKSAGADLIFGRGLSIRHPGRISLGHRVAVDDSALLDASGRGAVHIILGDEVIISRNCMVQAKAGSVTIGARTEIGPNTIISSISSIDIGKCGLIGPNCFIGGGHYITDRPEVPMMDLGWASRGPVVVGDDVWMGSGVVVLDGVRVGTGCVVGAGAVVTKNLPDYAIATGIPAKVVRYRPRPGQANDLEQGKAGQS